MTILNSRHNFKRDLERIKSISGKLDKKLSLVNISEEERISGLTLEELQDLSKIVGLADFMLYKYEEKKDLRAILEEFVGMIKISAIEIDGMDDEILELILSAEDSIKKVKDSHGKIYQKSCLGKEGNSFQIAEILRETGSINLTKIATEINTVGYQPNSKEEPEQGN